MVKWISWIGLTVLIGVGAVTLYCSDFARAGTYKIEYPQGYGTCCPPNAMQFGYFRTNWREWPGEIRRDKTFPRSIGMEAIPAPKGEEITPPPRIKVPHKAPGELPEEPGPSEGIEQPPGAMPGEEGPEKMPKEPGKEIPAFPGLPEEPGGFNPLPNLPPDLGAPTPLTPKEKEENNPTTEPKKENESVPEGEPKTDSSEKSKTDTSASYYKAEGEDARIKSPLDTGEVSRLDPDRHSPNIARGVIYLEPVESPISARLSREIASQSYQKHSESNDASTTVQSENQIDNPANELQQAVPSVALDGFCPVELSLHGRWLQGDPRWTVVYKGFIYRLSGNAQRQEFLVNPDKFIPANGGFDPVVSIAEKRNVHGRIDYCAAYKGRIYMFNSAASQDCFKKNPEMYVGVAVK